MSDISASAEPRPVDLVADGYVRDYAALDPCEATFAGLPDHEGELTDLSPAGFEAREELVRRAHAAMLQAAATDDRSEIARTAFLERMSVAIEQYAAKTPHSQIGVAASPIHGLRSVFDLMNTDSEEGWRAIDARLAKVPQALADYRETLLLCAETDHISAKRQLSAVAEQIRGWTGQRGGQPFFADLVSTASPLASESLQADLNRHSEAATSAYAHFGDFLARDLLPRGRDRDGVGIEQYLPESRAFLGAEIDPGEAYAWGWHELKRISDEMTAVSKLIVSDGTVDAAVAALDADPARTIAGKENFRDWMQDLADQTIDDLADIHFDIPEPIRQIECRIAPTTDGGIYYTGPSEDWSRPGQMWWEVPDGVDRFSTWREVTTVYHEGVPGHHLQVGQTAYRRELLNRWQRTLCWVSGHGEGWALYAERLMDELGYLEDPGNRLGMLDGQALRATRVIVDIGMHLELRIPLDNPFGFRPGEVWNHKLGLEFMQTQTRMGEAVTRFEVDRYLGWPGQAPSYKLGERIWLQARDDVRRRQGADFDLKQFHRAALDLGSIGLDPLRTALARL